MTMTFSVHVFPTITSDAKTLHVCKQQQIASGNKLFLVIYTLVSNWLMAVPMTIRLGTHIRQMASKSIFCYSKADLVGLDYYLLDVDYNPIYTCLDVNVSNQFLKSVLAQACHFYIPILQIPSYPSPKWFDAKIRHHLKTIHTVKRQLNEKHTNNRVLKLNTLEADLEEMISCAKATYIESLVTSFSSDPKKLYRYLRDLNKPSTPSVFVNCDGDILEDPTCIATCFNEFFNSTFTRSEYVLPSVSNLPSPSTHLSFVTIDASDVFEVLVHLDGGKLWAVTKSVQS